MTKCNSTLTIFQRVKGRDVEVNFSGGDVSSDGGVLLLKEADRSLGLTRRVAQVLNDPRDASRCRHSSESMLCQRVYGIGLGYDDLNDHDQLRHDIALQTAVHSDNDLASSPTLCRFEKWADRKTAAAICGVFVDCFIESFDAPPKQLILDFDATDDRVHGNQEGKFFHGYYDHYCFLPLYVFCGEHLLVPYLRPSNIDGAKHAWAILALLTRRFREEWPDVQIIFRADSGFCRHKMLDWCDRKNVDYIVGVAKNKRLTALCSRLRTKAEKQYHRTGRKAKLFCNIWYGAGSWKTKRRVIAKAEHNSKGNNPRFVTTSLPDPARFLYEKVYCARGDMENRIKEQQLGLFADRTSCQFWWSNQLRLMLSSMAYVLIQKIRTTLKGTEYEKAQASTIRLKLLKIGAVMRRNTRRIYFSLSSACPYQNIFMRTLQLLSSA